MELYHVKLTKYLDLNWREAYDEPRNYTKEECLVLAASEREAEEKALNPKTQEGISHVVIGSIRRLNAGKDQGFSLEARLEILREVFTVLE